MKNIIRLSSLLTMVMLLLVGATLTSCSDDDDNKSDWPSTFSQKAKINGTEYSIDEVFFREDVWQGVEYYVFGFCNDEAEAVFDVCVPKKSMNKLLDLTKDQRVNTSSEVTVYINNTYAYGDDSFAAGSTLIASLSGSTLKFYTKGKLLKQNNYLDDDEEEDIPLVLAPRRLKAVPETVSYTFDIQYSGTVVEGGVK